MSSNLDYSRPARVRLKKRQGRKKKKEVGNGREVNWAGEGKKLCSSNEIFLFCLLKISEPNVKMPDYAVKSMLSFVLVNVLKM